MHWHLGDVFRSDDVGFSAAAGGFLFQHGIERSTVWKRLIRGAFHGNFSITAAVSAERSGRHRVFHSHFVNAV